MPLRRFLLLALIASAHADDFPAPYNSERDASAQPPSAEEAVTMFELPEGFQATLLAAEPEVQNPIAMTWDWKGRMWVAENYTYAEKGTRFDLALRDRLLIFHDTDGDGRADSRKVFSEDLQMLTSVEVGRGGVWLMCPPQLLFIPDANGDDVPDGPAQVKLDGFTVAQSNYHNFANGLRWGPDGWLYGRCGHSCPGKVGVPGTPEKERVPIEGGIWRYHPDTDAFEVLTHGTTNPWGHDWDANGELFFINTVNGHLWHGIPGAHFTESFGADPNPGVYERIDTHADHYHYDRSGKWSESRDGKANAYGGGHSHIGMMIYQADQWPQPYRGRLFTLNQHGRRANVERLEAEGCGYVGKHEEDVFLMGDAWYRGIDIRQGPDGSAYILDWSDTGECHEHTGVHRTSGRIYRISYGNPKMASFDDLARLETGDGEALVRLLSHPNVWFARQARQRLVDLEASSFAIEPAKKLLANAEARTPARLQALWTLHALNAFEAVLPDLLDVSQPVPLQAWAIRLLLDDQPIDTIMGPRKENLPAKVPDALYQKILELEDTTWSPPLALVLASSLQRLNLEQRIPLATQLASRSAYREDHNLPAMLWYGLIPVTDAQPEAMVQIASQTDFPQLLTWGARHLAAQLEEQPEPLDAMLAMAAKKPADLQAAVLQGLSDGLQGWRQAPQPKSWAAFADSLDEAELDKTTLALSRDLSALFGDGRALDSIKKVALDPEADLAMRRAALNTLIENRPADLREICESLLDQRVINTVAVRGLTLFDDPELGQSLAKNYRRFYPAERPAVLDALVSRPAWAAALLDQMEAGRIEKAELSAVQARQIRAFGEDKLNERLATVWGEVRDSSADKQKLIEEWTAKLNAETLAQADLRQGRQLYQMVCSACHRMYGEGGQLGPDLTGSGRAHLDYLLENILDPSAVVSADYQMSLVTMKDGRLLSGVVAEETDRTLTLRLATEETTLAKDEIAKRDVSPVSMMPEGLFLALQPDQVRDLIAYLQHPQQVPLPE